MSASIPVAGNILRIPAFSPSYDEDSSHDISWSQTLRTKHEVYYLVNAKNVSQGDASTAIYIQANRFNNSNTAEHISKIAQKCNEDGSYDVVIDNKFQYGQKNADGEGRFIVYHNQDNKLYQHRFLVSTMQGKAAEWAKTLASTAGAGDIAGQVHSLGNRFVGHYLHTF